MYILVEDAVTTLLFVSAQRSAIRGSVVERRLTAERAALAPQSAAIRLNRHRQFVGETSAARFRRPDARALTASSIASENSHPPVLHIPSAWKAGTFGLFKGE